jgi:hypothetical protein
VLQQRVRRRSVPASSLTWRAWVTVYAIAAVAWPATGPLPWVALDWQSASHSAAPAASGGDASEHANRHDDDAGVPGSPTHPIDHDCAQCQVLKHLSRCALPDLGVAIVAPLVGGPEQACAKIQPQYVSYTVARPPIRGPPLHHA